VGKERRAGRVRERAGGTNRAGISARTDSPRKKIERMVSGIEVSGFNVSLQRAVMTGAQSGEYLASEWRERKGRGRV
jgi:hypothetical protein